MAKQRRYNTRMQTASIASTQTRNRRFERASVRIPFQLTERDAEIVLAVGRARFLSSRNIQTLFGNSRHILARLKGLYHGGYLDRPKAQLDYYTTTGSAPMVYALGDRGARLLNERYGAKYPEADWLHKNRSAGRPFIEHTLAIADMHVALTVAARPRPDVEIIDAKALIAAFPTPPATSDRAFTWRTEVHRNDETHAISVNPDYAFALRSPTISRRCYVVEVDRGTMPVERADYRQTSIVRKFAAYIAGHAAKLHERQFGWKAYRVLMITNTPERAEHMRIALGDLTKSESARQMFYFTHADAFAGGDILTHQWIDGNGRPQTLI